MRRRLARFLEEHGTACVYALMAIVLVGGAIYAHLLGDTLRYGDERDYDAIARNLVAGRGFSSDGIHPTAWRPPGYPFVIAAVRLLGLGAFSVRMVNFACLALDIWLLHRIALAEGRRVAGVVAGALVLGYPVLFYAAGTLFPQILGSALFLFTVWMCVRAGETWEMALAGVAFGFLILAVPYFLMLLPLLGLHPWLLGTERRWRRAVVAVGVATAVTGAWTARNAVVLHRLVPVSTNGGINLLQGNNPRTREMLGGGVSAADLDLKTAVEEAWGRFPDDEVAISNHLKELGVAWILANKEEAAKLYLLKCAYYFSAWNDLSTRSERTRWTDVVMLVTYAPLMALFALRLLLARRFRLTRLELFLLVVYVGNVLLSAVFYPRIRFRLPFDLLAIAVVAMFVDRLVSERQRAEPQGGEAGVAA